MNKPSLPMSFNKRRKPVGPGVSIGHARARGGTFGAVVRDNITGELLILSNNHVLANCSGVRNVRAKVGDPILQPSASDGGLYTMMIGRLHNWVPLAETGCNLVDAAVAKPLSVDLICSKIRDIGNIRGTAAGVPGMRVIKVGRSTGLTYGEITETSCSVVIHFAGNKYFFSDQMAARIHCKAGDSGAIVVNENNKAVGLLFAVEDDFAIINRIDHVISLLNIELV